MKMKLKASVTLASAIALGACNISNAETYDLVISGARVVDPETKLDQITNIGISGKEISVIT